MPKRGRDMIKPAKNIFTVVAVVAAILLPTFIAVGSYIGAQFVSVNDKNVTKLEITDTEGGVFSLAADNASDARDIDGFISINKRAIAQTSLPDPLVGNDYFEFKYYSYDRIQTYKYYFSPNPDEAYYVDSRGNAYHINANDAASFLTTRYARCLYDTTTFPTMQISNETLLPTEALWEYQTYGGSYVALDGIESAPATERIYEMKGAFALSFDNEPDFINVTVSDNGTTIFSDSYENIANASLEGRNIDVIVDAKWYESENEACYGSARYQFKAKVLVPAVFYLGETEIEPGEFVVISAKNVEDPSAIKFASDPDIGFTPTFFKDGLYTRALVPVRMDFKGESVKFTCSYGEVTQDMLLDITPKKFASSSLDISATIASQTRTQTTMNMFSETMAPIVAQTEAAPMWEGTFHEGTKDGNVRIGFGRYVTISGTGETYRHEGCDYLVNSGESIMAMNNGKVVYAGYLDLPGYIVVIDHGLGLKSWYAHLSSAEVKVGDTVAKGDVIGKAGSTGFTSRPICHITVSVYDVPVCQYDLWDNGVVMTQ